MSGRSFLSSVLLSTLAACASEPVGGGLDAKIHGRLVPDAVVPGTWSGTESVTLLDAAGEIVCADEAVLTAVDVRRCPDCLVAVEVTVDPDAERCALSPDEATLHAGGLFLGFVPGRTSLGVTEGSFQSASVEEGPWQPFAEGMRSDFAVAWDLEAALEHTVAADVEGGPVESSSPPRE